MGNAGLLICLLSLGGAFALPNSRIWEGNDATSGEFPWTASVRLDNAHICVGSIISENHILTAAHCVSQMDTTPYVAARITARVGSINQYASGSIVYASNITIHESYGNFLNDLAVIRLTEPLVWSTKIQKIELAEANTVLDDGTSITVSGWGLQSTGASPYKLQHTTLLAMSYSNCEYRAGFGYESILCLDHTENQGICRGDDGAGAVANKRLVGVVSFAFGQCATKYPDICSRIPYFLDWIKNNTK